VAVLETARGGLLRAGMGVRHCDVGAVLNVKSDHLGMKGIDTLEDLARVKRIVVETARDTAVLNADDPLCLKMADYTEAKFVCYVTTNPAHPLVREHIAAGGRGVVLETAIKGQMITIYDRGAHIPLLWTHLIPATLEGRAMHNVQNAMFAAAMAFAMGEKLENIRHGLRTFDTSFFQAPGRMNVFDEHPFRVILDYGHNAHAVQMLVQLVQRLDVKGRSIVVLAAPGDRRDVDIMDIGQAAAGHFDLYVCRRDDHRRGRDSTEVPEMLRKALLERGVPEASIVVVPDEVEAVDHALRAAREGDLVLVFADALTRTWKQILNFVPEATSPGSRGSAAGAARAVAPGGNGGAPDVGDESPAAPPASDAPEFDGDLLVRDERGVRLAREQDD
jgi:cyanophycin synthetase